MNYLSLRIVSVLIRLAAIVTACFVVLLFLRTIERQYQLQISLREVGDELETNTTRLSALFNQFGIDIGSTEFVAQAIGEDLFNSLTLRAFQDLFIGLVASLLIFGFGGVIRLLIDIAGADSRIDYAYYTHQDSNLAPTAPQRRSDFPPFPNSARYAYRVPEPEVRKPPPPVRQSPGAAGQYMDEEFEAEKRRPLPNQSNPLTRSMEEVPDRDLRRMGRDASLRRQRGGG